MTTTNPTTTTRAVSGARVAELIAGMENIAILPEIAARISATVNDPRSSATDLHKIISRDPALVARILKLVNSTRYATAVPIDSIDRAIVRLGFQTVQTIAIAATVGRLFTTAHLGDDFTAKDLWTHSVAVAATAQEVARKLCPILADQIFLGALMHDIGLLAAVQSCPDEMSELC